MSTAPSSPPRSPKKQELMDAPLHSIPSGQPSSRPGTDLRAQSGFSQPALPPLERRASAEETLPRLSSILNVPRTSPPQTYGLANRLETLKLSPSPDPSGTNDYVLTRHPCGPFVHDPITGYLNRERQERERREMNEHIRARSDKNMVPKSRHVLPFAPRRDTRQDYSLQSTVSPPRPLPQGPMGSNYDNRTVFPAFPPELLQKVQGGRIQKTRKSKDKTPHCNKRYTVEQKRFIRYLKCDCNVSWPISNKDAKSVKTLVTKLSKTDFGRRPCQRIVAPVVATINEKGDTGHI
ncbi:hypothetical protein TruAng_000102 [Truncatella angustata]|nr:hypothetical protein TruAng_000102 [Truncatella angustata]